MRSRRLPGSREPRPVAPENRPQVAPLFDGVMTTRQRPAVEVSRAPAPVERRNFGAVFGVRSLLAAAVLFQIAVALWMARRLVLALEYLSLHTGNLPILAALGAVAVGLFGWAWWYRGMRVAVCFCAVSIVWWLVFLVPSF